VAAAQKDLKLAGGALGGPSKKFTKEFKGNKWVIEMATAEQGVIEVEVEKFSHSVAIYNSDGATVVVKGKCSGLAIDSCKKSKVLLDKVVATLEISNCQRVQVQVKDFAPSVAIDKTDGCIVYLSKECVENQDFFVSAAKCSELNVAFPHGKDDEYVEKPLPEQFIYKFDLSEAEPKVISTVSDLYSA